MSNNILKDQDPIYVTDSRLLKPIIPRPVLRGASSILYKQWPSTAASKSGITFSCQTPLPGAEIDRCIQILCPMRVTTTAVWGPSENNQYLAQPQKIGIRSYPIQKALSSVNITLNNHAFTLNIGEILSGLEHFNTSRKLKLLEYSKCATYGTCQSQAFDDIRSGIRSGLAPYVSSISGIAPQNFPFTVYTNTPATVGNLYTAECVIDLVSIEPIFLAPFYWGEWDDNFGALRDIKTLDVNLAFKTTNPGFRVIAIQNTNSISNADRGGVITGDFQVKFTSDDNFTYSDLEPKLLVNYLKAQVPAKAEPKTMYPYYHINTYKKNHNSAVSTFTDAVIRSDNIMLSKLPSKIYIWARKPDSVFDADPFTPDAFCAIENVNMYWNNKSVLSEAHKGQLYDLSVKNGLQLEYGTYSGYRLNNETTGANFGNPLEQFGGTGSLLCLDPLDLGLDNSLIVSPNNEQIPLQVEVTIKNIAAGSFIPTLYVLVLTDGIMQIQDGVVTTHVGIADTDVSLEAQYQVAPPKRSGNYVGNYKIDIPMLIKGQIRR